MKSEKGILTAFILNLFFSVFEVVGGIVTGSVAIISDAVHDLGDAAAIGISFFLERKSRRQPDETHTYGYLRYSLLGSLIVTSILLSGSVAVTINAVIRIFNPTQIDYGKMLAFALAGVVINLVGAVLTHSGLSLNSRAVSLHLLEDVLGWVIVLVGAVVMKFTDFSVLDPIMSICVAVYIFFNAFKNLREILDIFLEKTPKGISVTELKTELEELDGVLGVHHIHIRSIDGNALYATMHIVVQGDGGKVKQRVRHFLKHRGIAHATLETEKQSDNCNERVCTTQGSTQGCRHGHHH